MQADDLAVGEPQVQGRRISGAHQRDAFGDVVVEVFGENFVSAGIATVIHQRHKGWLVVCLGIWQTPHLAKGTVDKLRTQFRIEKKNAEPYLVERRTQRQYLATHHLGH